jgi:hypothetical protein
MEVIERLDTEVVAGEEQQRGGRAEIADGESEHAVQTLHAIGAFLFVKAEEHLGVGVGGETVALAFEFPAQRGEVVDLAVVSDPEGAILVRHRHVAEGRQIEDGEAAVAQADVGTVRESPLPEAGVVRAAMGLDVGHPRQRFPISAIHQTADAAHSVTNSFASSAREVSSSIRRSWPWCETSESPENRSRSDLEHHPGIPVVGNTYKRKAGRENRAGRRAFS